MIIFNNKYQINIGSSHNDFIDNLISHTIIQEDLNTNILPDKKKDFVGLIEHRHFRLTRNKSSFAKNNYTINGTITKKDQEIEINGKITGYKFLLGFVIFYTIFCLIVALKHWFFVQDRIDLRIGFSIFSLIGIFNYFGIIHGLNKFKTEMIKLIKTY